MLFGTPHFHEPLTAGLVFLDPVLGHFAALDAAQQLLHCFPCFGVHDQRPGDVVAPLRRVADRIPHVIKPTLIDEVNDQLHLVHAFKICGLGLIARLDQRVESRFDERADSTAEHSLLSEKVGLGLFRERRLHHACARPANGFAIGERQLLCSARRVLMNRQQRRRSAPFGEHFAHAMSGSLGSDHGHIDVFRRMDRAVADVEAMRKHEHLARSQIRRNLLLVDLRLCGIRSKQHDHVGPSRGIAIGFHRKARGDRFLP